MLIKRVRPPAGHLAAFSAGKDAGAKRGRSRSADHRQGRSADVRDANKHWPDQGPDCVPGRKLLLPDRWGEDGPRRTVPPPLRSARPRRVAPAEPRTQTLRSTTPKNVARSTPTTTAARPTAVSEPDPQSAQHSYRRTIGRQSDRIPSAEQRNAIAALGGLSVGRSASGVTCGAGCSSRQARLRSSRPSPRCV